MDKPSGECARKVTVLGLGLSGECARKARHVKNEKDKGHRGEERREGEEGYTNYRTNQDTVYLIRSHQWGITLLGSPYQGY